MLQNNTGGALLQTGDFVAAFQEQCEVVREHRRTQRVQEDAAEAAFVAEIAAASTDDVMDGTDGHW